MMSKILWRPSLARREITRRILAISVILLALIAGILTTKSLFVRQAYASTPQVVGSNSTASIAIAGNSILRTEQFVVGSDSALWHRWSDGNGNSIAWESLGGNFLGRPAVAIHGTTIEVFLYDQQRQALSWRTYVPTANWWSAWKHVTFVNNFLPFMPAAVAEANGTVDLVLNGYQPSVGLSTLFRRQLRPDGNWSAWENLGNSLPNNLGLKGNPPALASWGAGRLDVFVIGTDRAVWQRSYDSGQWSDWTSLGGLVVSGGVIISPIGATSWGVGRLDVFALDGWGRLWHQWYDNGQWSGSIKTAFDGWEVLPKLTEVFVDGPAVKSNGPGELNVFESSDNGHVWIASYSNGSWSRIFWHNLPSLPGESTVTGPAVLAWNDPQSTILTPTPIS